MENKEPLTGPVSRTVSRHGRGREAVIPILQDLQQDLHYLPGEALQEVTNLTEITPADITGISTFFPQFRHQPAGKHTIAVCTGTACHVKGAGFVYESFRRALGLEGDDDTDRERLFTLSKVACLGCCTLAPVVRIDEVTYGHVEPEKAGSILRDFLEKAGKAKETNEPVRRRAAPAQGEIRIGLGSCCVASGSEAVRSELERSLAQARIPVSVKEVGCVGICNQVPVMEIVTPGQAPVFYARIKPEEVSGIIRDHFTPDRLGDRLRHRFLGLFDRLLDDGSPRTFGRYPAERRDTPLSRFLGPQVNIATEHHGTGNPTDLEDYRRNGGFDALQKCLQTLSPESVIAEITASGLRGRGGAGFPTGRKWHIHRSQPGSQKYVICNGDEGDPGAFMDRMLLESYPYRVIEGMTIAAYATGASEGIFYIRAEYPLAVSRVREAIERCEAAGLLGNNIAGSSFSFSVRIFGGAGAFICGEETALIASMEGRRGTPRVRPPYPVEQGFRGQPTLVNNTETLAMVPWIIRNSAKAFSAIGTKGSKGTKVFALAGKVKRGGLIEVPMGISIRQIVEEIGGGIAGDGNFKAVQIGGPSGGCLPAIEANLPIDYEALQAAGAMMGSGGLVVMDESDCMVDIARYFLAFTQNQSCGQCTFCRIGTRRMLELLDRIREGKGSAADLDSLEKLALSTRSGSLCGLGRTAPNPVLSTLRYFRHEYEAHLAGHCPAGKCLPLIRYEVTDGCIGCTICARQCPSDAIPFTPYERHVIDPEKCIKCDVCRQACPENAIVTR